MSLYFSTLRNFGSWAGRADRLEYWTFTAVNVVLTIAVAAAGQAATGTALPVIVLVVLLLPSSLAVLARRLHDGGRSAWWMLFSLVPFVGGLTVLVFTLLPGTSGGNRFGATAASLRA